VRGGTNVSSATTVNHQCSSRCFRLPPVSFPPKILAQPSFSPRYVDRSVPRARTCVLARTCLRTYMSSSIWPLRWLSPCPAALIGVPCAVQSAQIKIRFSSIIKNCDGSYSLPHPLILFFQASPTCQFSDASRLQRATPSVPLNGQSHPTPLSLSTPDQSCKPHPPHSQPRHHASTCIQKRSVFRLEALSNVLLPLRTHPTANPLPLHLPAPDFSLPLRRRSSEANRPPPPARHLERDEHGRPSDDVSAEESHPEHSRVERPHSEIPQVRVGDVAMSELANSAP